jgi:hypothetical protein
MFDSHELVYTHDHKTGQYSGGGYALNSELLMGGAPPLIAVSSGSGGGKKRRNDRRKSESGSDSGNDSDGSSRSSSSKPKVSSIISQHSSIVIPAGLFLIHGPGHVHNNGDDYDLSAFNANANIRPFLYNSDSDDTPLSDSSDDEDSVARSVSVRKDNNVIPDDIYTALFKMLSPNESDKKRYWVGSAVTCKRRRNKNLIVSAPHKTTRKQKK